MLACKRTGLATSCVFDCHIGPNIFTSQICILLLRIRVASSRPHRIFAPSHLRSGFSYLTFSYLRIVASQIFVSCIVASASHLRTFASQILTSQIFVSYIAFIFRSSYFETHLVFTVLCLHDVVTLSYLIKIFKISLSYIYNLIYLRLQNLISLNIISPLSGQPSSSSCLVLKRLPQEWSCLSFHVFTCTMGSAPIKWTCTASLDFSDQDS